LGEKTLLSREVQKSLLPQLLIPLKCYPLSWRAVQVEIVEGFL